MEFVLKVEQAWK